MNYLSVLNQVIFLPRVDIKTITIKANSKNVFITLGKLLNFPRYSNKVYKVGLEYNGYHFHSYLGHLSISQNNCAIKSMLFSISMRKTESPCEKKFFVTFGTCEKIEVKRGHLVKK